jgi:cell division protein FtsB
MLFSLLKVVSGKAQEENNINGLKSLLAVRVKQNSQLKNEYYYYNSGEYIQKIAREQLNLGSQDEYIVNFLEDRTQSIPKQDKNSAQIQSQITALLHK